MAEPLSTLGPLGHGAYGVEAAIIAGALVWRMLRVWLGQRAWSIVWLTSTGTAVPLTGTAELALGHDPSVVVLDEFVAMGLIVLAPFSALGLLLGSVLFGQFDHHKPLGIAHLEALPGGIGIVADDLGAMMATLVALWLIAWLVVHAAEDAADGRNVIRASRR